MRTVTRLAGVGQWRAFADFAPTGGEPLTLGVDVTVPGEPTGGAAHGTPGHGHN
ncbi:hypothetical protein O7614_04150 [Micromonospora sp. WMMD961]|uniref:hypothetical protein n=1 Tax=Micromonospora sp. WMMD961 TaxID=3016100 RepID=UPI0024164226|nr:hypothetical protein [Micromonospora sp. WMMD961]MDG4778838.1 hypothetical protein [Micromonospora sp. WMMD961]